MKYLYLWNRIKEKIHQCFKPPQQHRISLKRLISRAENRFIAKTHLNPKCPFCGNHLIFRWSSLQGPYELREDQKWKCANCFFTCNFGLPLTKEEFKTEKFLRGGTLLSYPTARLDERTKEMKARLRELGYLAFED